ncbi:hypothetical protein [Paenibacillus silvae]|uniref:hypothetical protein n=1 Tax=Paenibacillus silvae TaxID=1325358 RepID=UPI002003B5C9|nr:hypothetical protein [Paenibacillus silvae]
MGEYKTGLLANRWKCSVESLVTNKRLAQAGYYDFPAQYEHLRQSTKSVEPPPYPEWYVRWCGRSAV